MAEQQGQQTTLLQSLINAGQYNKVEKDAISLLWEEVGKKCAIHFPLGPHAPPVHTHTHTHTHTRTPSLQFIGARTFLPHAVSTKSVLTMGRPQLVRTPPLFWWNSEGWIKINHKWWRGGTTKTSTIHTGNNVLQWFWVCSSGHKNLSQPRATGVHCAVTLLCITAHYIMAYSFVGSWLFMLNDVGCCWVVCTAGFAIGSYHGTSQLTLSIHSNVHPSHTRCWDHSHYDYMGVFLFVMCQVCSPGLPTESWLE